MPRAKVSGRFAGGAEESGMICMMLCRIELLCLSCIIMDSREFLEGVY